MRDSFIRQGLSEDDAKEKAARIWNSKHKGAQAVGRHYDEKNMSALDKIIQLANETPTIELASSLRYIGGAPFRVPAAKPSLAELLARRKAREEESSLANAWPREAKKLILQSFRQQPRSSVGQLESETGQVLARSGSVFTPPRRMPDKRMRSGRIDRYQLPTSPKYFSSLVEFAEKMPYCDPAEMAAPIKKAVAFKKINGKDLYPSGRPMFNLEAAHPFGIVLLGVGDAEAALQKRLKQLAGKSFAPAIEGKAGEDYLKNRLALYKKGAPATVPPPSSQVRTPLAGPIPTHPPNLTPNPNAPNPPTVEELRKRTLPL